MGVRERETYSERSGSVTGGSPAPTTVETEALIGNNLDDTAATESLGVRLSLDLENVEREKDNLSNTNQTKRTPQVSWTSANG